MIAENLATTGTYRMIEAKGKSGRKRMKVSKGSALGFSLEKPVASERPKTWV